MDKITIFDTTLRDGEQGAVKHMSPEEKIMIAEALDRSGVDVIEAGFPASNDVDFRTIQEISRVCENAKICGLARAKEEDILRVVEAIPDRSRRRIHTFISTSDIHIQEKLKSTPAKVLEKIDESVRFARQHADDVEWSAEDATRTDVGYLCLCVETAIRAGATTINLPDTVGYASPESYADMFKQVMAAVKDVPGADQVIFSAHCHNDLGMATANSLAAIGVGVRQIECTVNGIGERAGNAAMEEVVMALRVRQAQYGMDVSHIDARNFTDLSEIVAASSACVIQPNKAIVGAHAFAHRSGIHQDGMAKDNRTYEIIDPRDVGRESEIILSKLSGKRGFEAKVAALGIELSHADSAAAFSAFQDFANRAPVVTDDDVQKICARFVPVMNISVGGGAPGSF